QAVGEIKGACGRIDFFLNNAKEILQEEERYTATGLTEKVSYEPLGVIANISAWNYPYLVGVNVFIPALIAGNAVLYKPSEYSTLTGLAIERLLHQAGIPQNVFVCIKGTGEVGAMLLDLPLDAYFFTGSYKTGQLIYTKVAPKMVPCQMELGGKDPLYVSHHNSDIKGIAAATADGAFYNNGQSCCAVERIYVHEAVYETYAEAFIEEVKAYKIGEPSAADTYIGPLTRKDQMNVL
ncbi:MAG TPA: aldehyde dehydrogenase family protein, partial [Saprospiraceae bacterium]|nr:aldehyde dehydrogenase family protein [Saprospiraceae bacterium]